MTSIDPYHDKDAVDINIGTPINQGESPFSKTLKQMGQAIKSGGFCSLREEKENEVKSSEREEKAIDTTVEINSLSDDSQCDEPSLENVKSVSFRDTEPLIVDLEDTYDEAEDATTEDVVQEKSHSDKTKEQFPEPSETVKEAVQLTHSGQKSKGPATPFYATFIFFVISVVALFEYFDLGVFKPTMLIVESMYSYVEPHLVMLQIRVEDKTGLEFHKILFGLVVFMAALASTKTFVSDEKALKSVLEFTWGAMIYAIVSSGVYFAYDLGSN